MSTIVTATIPAEEFALAETLAADAATKVDIERVAAHTANDITPYVWVTAENVDVLDDALGEDSTVQGAKLVEELDGVVLYRMNWVASVDVLTYVLNEEGATVLDAYAEDDWWRFRLLYPERDGLSRTDQFCRDGGFTFNIESIHEMESERSGRFGLTESQYTALRVAGEHGYYEVPRDASTEELAEQLGISHQALSERLRRGHQAFVQNAILVGPEETDGET